MEIFTFKTNIFWDYFTKKMTYFLNEQGLVIPVYNDIQEVLDSGADILCVKSTEDYHKIPFYKWRNFIKSMVYAINNDFIDVAVCLFKAQKSKILISADITIINFIKDRFIPQDYIHDLYECSVQQLALIIDEIPEILNIAGTSYWTCECRQYLITKGCKGIQIHTLSDLELYTCYYTFSEIVESDILHYLFLHIATHTIYSPKNILKIVEYLYNNHFELLTALLQKRNANGYTPLLCITYKSDIVFKIIELCVAAGADIRANNKGNMIFGFPMHVFELMEK